MSNDTRAPVTKTGGLTMWIVLPTKGCECVTCKKIREVIDEDGNPVTGASVTDGGFRELRSPCDPDNHALHQLTPVRPSRPERTN